jgi:hypothetical protein
MSEEKNIPGQNSKDQIPNPGERNLDKHEPVTQLPETDNQSPKNMEVHHHSHAHGRKNWKAYFWEFLMLFLAVFCGFLAEYQLEHIIEHQREKQYMQSFIHDLASDTSNLNEGFPRKDQRLRAIDSVFLFFEQNPGISKVPGYVYRNMARTLWDRQYRRYSTTNDQLKNAGGMRLIRKKRVADSIAAYDWLWQRAEFWREAYTNHQEKAKVFVEKIINANDLLRQYRTNTPGEALPPSLTDNLVIGINTEYLNEFLNDLNNQRTSVAQDRRFYHVIATSAERLIELIKKEYHLE